MMTNSDEIMSLNAVVADLKRISNLAELNSEKLDALAAKVRKVTRANSETEKRTGCIDIALFASKQQEHLELFNAMTLDAANNAIKKVAEYANAVLAEQTKEKDK